MASADEESTSQFFFAWMGVASAVVFSNLGAGYGTARSGVGLMSMGVMAPTQTIKNVIPCVMAGILGIYGLIVGIILSGRIMHDLTPAQGYAYLASGLCCGLSGLASGMAIGIAGDAAVRAVGHQPALYVPMILVMIFGEAIGLYGLIVSLVLAQK